MKNKSLLPILLLAAFALGACNLGGQSSKESKEEPASSQVASEFGVAIANKAALQEEFYVGSNRDLDVTLTPAANPLKELGKALTIESSDPETVKVTGLGLTGLKIGTATITVKYHDAQDSVELSILDGSPIGRYGVAHAGTAADPFTNEDALAVAKNPKYADDGGEYYVRGKVASFYNAPGSRTDGMVAYFLEPAEAGGEKFEIYKCFKEDGSALTDDDIWVGGTATAYGAFTKYNDQYETSSAKFVSCEGNKPQPRTTVEKTFAEALALGVALDDGADSYDYIKFTGFVSARSGNNYFLTATKGEALVPGKSDKAHGERDIPGVNAIELYNAGKVEALVAKLLEGAEVEVTMIIKNYHGTVENGLDLTDESVVVKQQGTAWSVPEPEVTNKTLTEFIALENKADKAYNVTATIKSWKDASSAKDQYGNMVLTDGTNDLTVYGASATATALAWDNAGSYAFTNPRDFLTNEVTAALAIGNEITMKMIRADYKGAIQGSGVITAVTPVAATAIALDKTTAEVEVGATVKLTATLTPANSNSAVTWHSSDDTIATVNNGLVAGVAAGQATITAKVSDEIKAECVVTVNAPASAPVALPADGLTINPAALDLATNNTYDKNKNREVTVNGMNLVLDPESAGSVTKASAPYTSTGAVGVDCIQFKKGGLIAIRTKDRLEAAVQATVKMYTYGYATEAKNYLPAFKLGASADPILANETNGGTVAVAGVDTGKVYNDKGTDKVIYEYTLTYDLSALHEETLTLVTAESGAAYVGSIVISNQAAQPEVAQPVGAFRGLAKTAAATFIPVDLVLAADSAALSVNGEAANVTSYTWDKVDTLTIVTDGAYGTVTAKFADNVFQITGLTGAAVSQLDLTYAVKLSASTQYIDCSVMDINAINATFLRRYDAGSGWVANTPEQNKMASVEIDGRRALKCNGYSGKIGLSLKNDFATPIPGTVIKSIGCWIYNSGSESFNIVVYGYKGANRTSAAQLNTFTVEPGWHFYQTGVVNGGSFTTADSLYNFQLYYQGVTSCDPVFDDFYLYM